MPLKAPAFWEQRGAASSLLMPAAAAYGLACRVNSAMTTPVKI